MKCTVEYSSLVGLSVSVLCAFHLSEEKMENGNLKLYNGSLKMENKSSNMENGSFHKEEDTLDQYTDKRIACMWESYIGNKQTRAENYKKFLVQHLKERGCKTVLDVACGTGIDSVMLLEEGFKVTSTDASDEMLKYALKTRWERRNEKAFDEWIIEQANWLSLPHDLGNIIGDGFDAVICLGNSFAHLLDITDNQDDIRTAIENFEKCVKRGGLLIIDHRNFDQMLDQGFISSNPLYYNSDHKTDIAYTSYRNGKANSVVLDFVVGSSRNGTVLESHTIPKNGVSKFRMSFYPHRLNDFSTMLREVFGPKCKHTIYGDFKLINKADVPGFYIHFMEKVKA